MNEGALSFLQIKNPKSDERSAEAAQQIFSSLLSRPYVPVWKKLAYGVNHYAFELYLLSQTVYFYITSPAKQELLVKSLIQSSYPSAAIQKTTDPMDLVLKAPHIAFAHLTLQKNPYLPIKTYDEFKEVDALAPLIGFLSKQDPSIRLCLQVLITPAGYPWQSAAQSLAKPQGTGTAPQLNPTAVAKKTSASGGKAVIRLTVGADSKAILDDLMYSIGSTFGVFSSGEGNSFGVKKVVWGKEAFKKKLLSRNSGIWEYPQQILNAKELATLWHPAGSALSEIKNVAWGKSLAGEPPANLPVADGLTEEEKMKINFFAKTEFKNKETIFGLKEADRRRHTYIIGKTGAGKSTLIANMAIDDIRKGRGVGVIDPHGDLCEDILNFIPKRRIKDVVYLEPFDSDFPFALNVLEIKNKQLKDLISSGIVSIFKKLYTDSWGPRLEYILRNSILTLLEVPGATLPDILELLSNSSYRKAIVPTLKDPIIKSFWENEFEKMNDKLKTDAISPIQNKIGQFVQTKMIRNIIGEPKSTVDLREIMDSKKILLLNLSQGKLGEDNAALLGAMIITQIQLAAMGRAFVDEEKREDFFLYVDEFQNFATSSFVKILSEARKYRLSLILANQYIDQIDESIQHAIFGNVGTLVSFIVGAKDAEVMSKQFQGVYTESDLVGLGKHEIVLKLCIDNMTSNPFPARTLPPPAIRNDNAEEIIKYSKERYGRKVKEESTRATPLPSVKPAHTHAPSPAPQREQKVPPTFPREQHKDRMITQADKLDKSPRPMPSTHAKPISQEHKKPVVNTIRISSPVTVVPKTGKFTKLPPHAPLAHPKTPHKKPETHTHKQTHKPFQKIFTELLNEDDKK